MNYPGFLIKRERLLKNWSQEGLCKGICAVSYLSKIEQGKAEASEEIISALFERLGIDWVTDEKLLLEGKKFVEDWYEAVFSAVAVCLIGTDVLISFRFLKETIPFWKTALLGLTLCFSKFSAKRKQSRLMKNLRFLWISEGFRFKGFMEKISKKQQSFFPAHICFSGREFLTM